MDRRWEALAHDLEGSFTARVRGLVSPEIVLLSARGEPFGYLRAADAGETRLRAGDLSATFAPSADAGHTLKIDGGEILDAKPAGSATALDLRSGNRTYRADISLLRNSATAGSSGGPDTARISGGLTNRRYRVTFDPGDAAALPIAVFLLDRLLTLRRGAFRTRS
jgi:hypothetical protein